MKRTKYKAKNIHAFKRIYTCECCDEPAIVTYSEESEKEDAVPVTRRRCPAHVHWTKPKISIEGKEVTVNRYKKLENPSSLLDLTAYMARG